MNNCIALPVIKFLMLNKSNKEIMSFNRLNDLILLKFCFPLDYMKEEDHNIVVAVA